jgi:ADP-ribosylglycohydrolase
MNVDIIYGAIGGDIAGALDEVEECKYIKTGHRPVEERLEALNINRRLLPSDSCITDDSLLTLAIIRAIVNDESYEKCLREAVLHELEYGNDKFGRPPFSRTTCEWAKGNNEGISDGNGAAMRISPLAISIDKYDDIVDEVVLASTPTHKNPNAILAAVIMAKAIWLANHQASNQEIVKMVEDNGISMDMNITRLQEQNIFSSKGIETVPQAIFCYLKAPLYSEKLNISNYEATIRLALSIGGDTDTIACMAGALAVAKYGLPKYIKEEITKYLSDEQLDLIEQFKHIKKGKVYERRSRKID